MKKILPLVSLACVLGLGLSAIAQPKRGSEKKAEPKAAAPKTAADLALDEFNKVRNAPGAKDQGRFQNVIATGMAYITQFPTHTGVSGAIVNLAFYGGSIDKKQAALKTAYLSLLKLDTTNYKYKDGLSDPAKAAIAGLDAAIADAESREAPTPANLATMREKIDELAAMPGGGRFLVERERSYAHIVALSVSMDRAEAHLRKLTEHKEKTVQAMAKEELNIFDSKKTPFALKFTGVDGKPVDFEQLRGKVVGVYFWSTTNSTSTKKIEALKRIHSTYRKRGFEMVGVSYDTEADRAKLIKMIKDTRLPWPVYFDGKGAKGELAPRLNATSVPRLYLFDQKGILQTTVAGTPVARLTADFPDSQVESKIKTLLGVK